MGGVSRDRGLGQIPEGYKWCPHCNGYGSSLKDGNERCARCNGTGPVAADRASEAASAPTNGKADR
jgi:DnaJ-class molecular chaperone